MKNSFYIFILCIWSLVSCSSKEPNPSSPPTNLSVLATVANDSSGSVSVSVSAVNVVSFELNFGDGGIQTISSSSTSHLYSVAGNYTINVIAKSADKQTITKSVEVKIVLKSSNGTFSKLVWSDEFNTDGAPDPTKWTYDLGSNNGWGNSELEYYTNRPNNVILSNGTLKIIAQKENYNGSGYTSTRLLTKGIYSFNYGKMEVRAKIPGNQGTWPAIWMLGSNIDAVSWPYCGEIDLMEHVGGPSETKIYTTMHFYDTKNESQGTTQVVQNLFSDFHTYSIIWNPTSIKFSIDDVLYYTFPNNSSLPFNQKFFIILNMAIGGNFGGVVDPNFTSAQMEVDYVRVYQ